MTSVFATMKCYKAVLGDAYSKPGRRLVKIAVMRFTREEAAALAFITRVNNE